MKKGMFLFFLLLLVVPFAAAQDFNNLYNLYGLYDLYWQWFDLAISMVIFVSLAEFTFVQKMQMHKGIAVGVGLALSLSMLGLEVATGTRMIDFGPYVAFIVALLLWITLWVFLNTLVERAL